MMYASIISGINLSVNANSPDQIRISTCKFCSVASKKITDRIELIRETSPLFFLKGMENERNLKHFAHTVNSVRVRFCCRYYRC